MKKRYFVPLGETLYRKRKGILVLRDCCVGYIPRYMWPRIEGRKSSKAVLKVRPWRKMRFF